MDKDTKNTLKAQAHFLKPVILMGIKGITPALIEETNLALEIHELIKVKLAGVERMERLNTAQALGMEVQAELLQIKGSMAIFYRKNLNKH